MSKILVTSALPYANGPIHLGHLVEYLLTDFYVRFMRSCGEDIVYVCADDTHGTPIEIKAQQMGIKPEELVGKIGEEHRRDFGAFGVGFDHFSHTNTPENQRYTWLIFERLKAGGHTVKAPVELTYCENDKRFLPDRYVKGTCPKCGATDQYGDVCEKCNTTYSPTDLKEPKCAICGKPPVRKTSENYFVKLSDFEQYLKEWSSDEGVLDSAIRNQLMGGFLGKGLANWEITRDGPYFGFTVPGEPEKYFYVWFDAPIGYIAATENYLKAKGGAGQDLALSYWDEKADSKIFHFIGKDIINFHALFWPAMLKGAALKRPDKLFVHGHLTINGEKMSKSRGTFITAQQYLDVLDPSYLRYFYASNLGPSPEDIDLSLKEFRLKVNAELVNNLGNLCNRALSILATKMGGKLSGDRNAALLDDALKTVPIVRAAYSKLEMRQAIRAIVELGERTNKFVQDSKPWEKVTSAPEEARRDLSTIADIAYLVATMLSPVVPKISEEICSQLGAKLLTFKDLEKATGALLPANHTIGAPKPIIGRLDEKVVEKLVVQGPPASAEPQASARGARGAQAGAAEPQASARGQAPAVPGIATYDDFCKLDLRIGKVLTAERVPKADKLLKLSVDLGEAEGPRTIAAGIAEAYAPEQVVGKRVVVVSNLAKRAIRGIESNGMLLAAGEPKTGLTLVDVPGELPPGTRIK